jgi:hypothetical protein
MTKKDYKAIAEAVAEVRRHVADFDLSGPEAVDSMVKELSHVFMDDNPRYDHSRFVEATLK